MKAERRQPLTPPPDPWDTRFAFFWYNDQEIFHDTPDDLARKAKTFADMGINHVITFSCTHFRWSFRRHWNLLTETLARIVTACHAVGIRVTEHHSAHLTLNPIDEPGERYLNERLRHRGSRLESWPHLREDCDADPLIEGMHLSSWRQIDGRTGRSARSAYPGKYDYQGWTFCFNNPDYRHAYLTYLETLYAVGIDGIMTDDIEWFGAGHACACATCQAMFADQTGYDLPEPGPAWQRWHGDYRDPSYIAWLRFRLRSITEFHRAVRDHYAGLGLRPLRPNYTERSLHRDPHAASLEDLPDLDWIFKENDFSTMIRYSWCSWAIEATHRFAVGRWRGIPAMSMFYPDRPDTVRFGWALAMSWGHLYLASPEGESLVEAEKHLRRFEVAHPALLRRVERVASIGFYDSRTTRNLYEHAESRSLRGLVAWAQACYRRNVPFDLFQREELDRLSTYRVAVLNEAAFLSGPELEALLAFVRAGGTLVWTGRTGLTDETGAERSTNDLARFWGMDAFKTVPDGAPTVTTPIGAGRLVQVAGDRWLEPVEEIARPPEGGRQTRLPYEAVSGQQERLRDELVEFLVGLSEGSDLELENLPSGVLAAVFASENSGALMIHLVNSAQTLEVAPGASIGHDDVIPFPRFTGAPVGIILRMRAALSGRAVCHARYHDPDVAEPRPLAAEATGNRISVTLDPAWIGFYGLIEIDLD